MKPSVAGIGHVGLKAQHLPSLSSFYADVVGFEVLERHDGCHLLDAGGGALLEIWSGGSAAPSRKSPAQQSVRVCFLVESLEPLIESLNARGLVALGEIGSYSGTRWIHYTDPEGNAFGFVDMNG